MFLNLPKTGWCLYAHRVPAGTYNTQLFVVVMLKAHLPMFAFSTSVMCMWILCSDERKKYLQPVVNQHFASNKSEMWS